MNIKQTLNTLLDEKEEILDGSDFTKIIIQELSKVGFNQVQVKGVVHGMAWGNIKNSDGTFFAIYNYVWEEGDKRHIDIGLYKKGNRIAVISYQSKQPILEKDASKQIKKIVQVLANKFNKHKNDNSNKTYVIDRV